MKLFFGRFVMGLMLVIPPFLSHQLALGQETSPHVLFVGNSLTTVNHMPRIIASLAKSRGHHLEFDVYTPGGYTLADHARDPVLLAKIKNGLWDYVILQEQGQRPAWSERQVQTDVYPFARQLSDLIRQANPKADVIFYMTMARKSGDPGNRHVAEELGTYAGMQKRIARGYVGMAKENHGVIAPVGRVWQNFRDQNPAVELYADDMHPNLTGSYLAACVLYEVLFDESSKGLPHPSGMDNDTAVMIQEATSMVARAPGWDFREKQQRYESLLDGLDVDDLRKLLGSGGVPEHTAVFIPPTEDHACKGVDEWSSGRDGAAQTPIPRFQRGIGEHRGTTHVSAWGSMAKGKELAFFDLDGQPIEKSGSPFEANDQAFVQLAKLYNDKAEYDEARAASEKAIQINPNNAEAYMNRASAHLMKFDQDQAISDYNRRKNMSWILIWAISIMATIFIAEQKGLGVTTYFILSLVTGPLAVILVLLVPSGQGDVKIQNIQDAGRQLNELKNSLLVLEEKIHVLELSIPQLSEGKPASPPEKMQEISSDKKIEKTPVTERPEETANQEMVFRFEKPSDMELDFGRNWLNKIGVVVFTLGMGFLISYTFKYFGPFWKIMFGYCAGAVLFFLGSRLEAKEKFVHFGRVLLGGGWALVYFTTYAMHHFEASRIIQNQFVDLLLLSVVAAGMILHVMKYKSETMMSVALFVAYLTATMGQITAFTVLSCLLLAFVILFLVYKFQWVRTFILGVVLTYAIHHLWVEPNIHASAVSLHFLGFPTIHYQLLLSFVFLTAYWLVFLAGIHIARISRDSRLANTLAAVNFGNIVLYSVLIYPMIQKIFYAQRFELVLSYGVIYLMLALLMKRIGREKLYVGDMVAAVFLMTFSLCLKFLTTTTLLLWLIEIPFLVFVGFHFKDKIFRYLGYGLTIFMAFRMIFSWGELSVRFLGWVWTWQEFMFLWAAIAMSGCFYLTQRAKKEKEFNDIDQTFDQFFSGSAFFYLTFLIYWLVKQPWMTFGLTVEGMALFVGGVLLSLARFRVYSYFLFVLAPFVFLFEDIAVPSVFLRWFIITADVLAFFGIYLLIKHLKKNRRMDPIVENEEAIAFGLGIIMLITAVFRYIHPQWISLSLGMSGVLFIMFGMLRQDKIERMGGLVLLGLTLGRVVFIDLAELDIIFKIITFIILGVLFIGVSFFYNRLNMKQEKKS